MRDPRMCKRPICECEHNGFKCAVSSWQFDYQQQRKWGESWGAVPMLSSQGVAPMHTYRLHNARCYVSTGKAEGCQCEGEVAFFSFDPLKVKKPLLCQDVLQSFGGRLASSLPTDVIVPSPGGLVNCPNNL